MKLLMLYVECARNNKSFKVKASCIVATVFSLIGLAVNMASGVILKDAIMMSLILWMIWYVLWIVFTKQVVKVSAKIKERNVNFKEQNKVVQKAKKRKMAEERNKKVKKINKI